MRHSRIWLAAALASGVAVTGSAVAQQMFAYPPTNRTPVQQQQDQFECHQWAVQQTQFDPVQYAAQSASTPGGPPAASTQGSPAASSPTGNPSNAPRRQGAAVAGGAAQGAIVAGASGGHPGEGAAAGAVLRALHSRRRSNGNAKRKWPDRRSCNSPRRNKPNKSGNCWPSRSPTNMPAQRASRHAVTLSVRADDGSAHRAGVPCVQPSRGSCGPFA
jgi:hypothetical protein